MAKATTKKTAPAAEKAAKETKGTSWLAELVNEKCGTSHTAYQLRILLRKLAKEGALERSEGNYSFTGERDPQVVAVIKAVKAGDLEAQTKERVSKAKASKAADDAPARRTRRKKAEPVEDDEDMDLDEI